MGSAESRVYLCHLATGAALVKRGSGDCPCEVEPLTDVLASWDAMWKIECYGLDREGRPNLLYIRNDYHPQRALNAAGDLVDCSMRASKDDELWIVNYTGTEKHTFALQNRASGMYLTIGIAEGGSKYKVDFQAEPCYWFASLAKYAPSVTQVFVICAVAPIAAVVAAVSGGAGGIALAPVLGWGTGVMGAAGATAGGLASITATVAKIASDPAGKDWVVNKM